MPYTAKIYNTNLLSEENVKNSVLPYYDLKKANICQIKFKNTAKQRAVYKIALDDNLYCLKKVYFQKDELLFVYSAIEWLYRNNINVPRILPTSQKSRYVDYNNMLFILTPWVEGVKCNYDNINHVNLSCENLSSMHKCSVNFQPILGSKNRYNCHDLYNSLYKHFNQLLQCSNKAFLEKDSFSKLFLKDFDISITLAKYSIDIAATINNKYLFKSLCHLDYVNKNILFDANNKIWVIDFDKCKMDYCVHDIAYFLRRYLKRENTKWNIDYALECIKSYEKVRKLSLDEHKYILSYLAFPQKYWKISRDYYNNLTKCNKKSFQTLLIKSTELNRYQLDFVKKFNEYITSKF